MLEYFGGVPNLIVPDNLKSAITKACRYDPDANGAYQQWAAHYGVAMMPTRPRRPKDKAVAENSVQQDQRWILAPLRDHRFESLSQLNREIRRLLEQVNSKPFSERPGSRRAIFEPVARAQDRCGGQPLAGTHLPVQLGARIFGGVSSVPSFAFAVSQSPPTGKGAQSG